MSIYSGFPTRRDEQKYNSLLSKLILTLQTHLLQLIGDAVPAHGKVMAYSRIIAKMQDYEEHKYLPPKFTDLLAPLCKTFGILAAIDQRVPTECDDRNSHCQERAKVSTQSLNKQRAKSNFHFAESEEGEGRFKMDSMVLPKQICNEAAANKKGYFQSSFELKERKFNPNILPPKDDRLKSTDKSTDQYEEPIEHLQKWATLMQTRTTKGINVSKLKTNLRYQRAVHGFNQAQENKRKGQLRQDQRKLKKSQSRAQ